MRHIIKTTLPIAAVAALTACSGQDLHSYAGMQPSITVQSFYNAPVEGYGFFQDTSGQVKDRYYATLIPSWDGNKGTLHERQWNDKGKLIFEQDWNISVAENGHDFTATATRIDGPVTGDAQGYALHMTYVIETTRDNGDQIALSADDWTYLQPDGHGINKVSLHKFGLHVGDITYDLHKVPNGKQPHEGYITPKS